MPYYEIALDDGVKGMDGKTYPCKAIVSESRLGNVKYLLKIGAIKASTSKKENFSVDLTDYVDVQKQVNSFRLQLDDERAENRRLAEELRVRDETISKLEDNLADREGQIATLQENLNEALQQKQQSADDEVDKVGEPEKGKPEKGKPDESKDIV